MILLTAALTAKSETPTPDKVRGMLGQYYHSLSKLEVPETSKEQQDLGRMLFFDKRLSPDKQTSCNDCHDLEKYGTGGEAWKAYRKEHRKTRGPSSLYHAAHLDYTYWDGGVRKGKAFSPTNNPFLVAFTRTNEMALASQAELTSKLKDIKGYVPLFKAAFPEDKQPLSAENAGLALLAFANGLMTPAPYDRFMDGDDKALTDTQLKGAMMFTQKDCSACHTGPFFGGQMVQKLGVVAPWPNQDDRGYAQVTGNDLHAMYFRVAPLRNAAKTAPYFHDSSTYSLKSAIRMMAMYESGKMLESEEIDLLIEFINSLTGEIPEDYIREPKPPK